MFVRTCVSVRECKTERESEIERTRQKERERETCMQERRGLTYFHDPLIQFYKILSLFLSLLLSQLIFFALFVSKFIHIVFIFIFNSASNISICNFFRHRFASTFGLASAASVLTRVCCSSQRQKRKTDSSQSLLFVLTKSGTQTNKQTNKWTNRQRKTDEQTNNQTNKRTDKMMNRQKDMQTNRQTYLQTN